MVAICQVLLFSFSSIFYLHFLQHFLHQHPACLAYHRVLIRLQNKLNLLNQRMCPRFQTVTLRYLLYFLLNDHTSVYLNLLRLRAAGALYFVLCNLLCAVFQRTEFSKNYLLYILICFSNE